MKKRTILIPVTILFAGCFTTKTIGPSQADVDRVQTRFPGYTLAELKHGKALYEENCGTCHPLESPADFTEEQWKKLVPNMVKKANKPVQKLDKDDERDILQYVITMSGVGK